MILKNELQDYINASHIRLVACEEASYHNPTGLEKSHLDETVDGVAVNGHNSSAG